jgi:hypothetical protein
MLFSTGDNNIWQFALFEGILSDPITFPDELIPSVINNFTSGTTLEFLIKMSEALECPIYKE